MLGKRDFSLGFGQFRFSGTEILHLLASAFVISLIFAYPFSSCASLSEIPCVLLSTFLVFLVVGSAFIIHESSHKLTAQYYRVWSEYRMWTHGLLLALIMKITIGFTFIAPGAAYFVPFRRHGPWTIPLTKEQIGRISFAGPLSNIALAGIFFALSPFLGALSAVGISVNLSLALFNLLPFPPMDGAAIFSWSWKVWLAALGSVLALQFFLLPG